MKRGHAVLLVCLALGVLVAFPSLSTPVQAATGTWTPTGSLHETRSSHTATRLANGRVLVVGGNGPTCCTPRASAELYDPATGTWTATGSLHQARDEYTATLLPNGRVLVAGGPAGESATNTAELYD